MANLTRPVIIFILGAVFLTSGCTALNITGKAVGTVGKVAVATVKTTGKVAGKAVALTGKGIKTIINMTAGKHVVGLTKKGNSLLVDTLINRKLKTKLILDTGCTDTQISEEIARSLGIKTSESNSVLCQLADGRSVSGREINIKELKVGTVRVYNVKAIVLGSDKLGSGGLLGMSFLNNFIFRIDPEKGELILQRRI